MSDKLVKNGAPHVNRLIYGAFANEQFDIGSALRFSIIDICLGAAHETGFSPLHFIKTQIKKALDWKTEEHPFWEFYIERFLEGVPINYFVHRGFGFKKTFVSVLIEYGYTYGGVAAVFQTGQLISESQGTKVTEPAYNVIITEDE